MQIVHFFTQFLTQRILQVLNENLKSNNNFKDNHYKFPQTVKLHIYIETELSTFLNCHAHCRTMSDVSGNTKSIL